MGQRAAAHEGQRRDLDLAVGEAPQHLLGRHHVVERVVERPEIGIDLLAQIAGQEAQPLARLDRRARQHDAVDLAPGQMGDGDRDGEIGLAGAGRAEAEDQLALLQLRADIAPGSRVRGVMWRRWVRMATPSVPNRLGLACSSSGWPRRIAASTSPISTAKPRFSR